MARFSRFAAALAALALLVASPADATPDPEHFEEITGGASQGPAAWLYNWSHWGVTPAIHGPLGLASNAASQVFVADAEADRVVVTYPGGDFHHTWGRTGTAPGRFDEPCGVAITPTGEVLVVDRGNDRVQRFTQRGRFLAQWGGAGSGPGQFEAPCGIAVAPTGRVYVADTGNDRIQVFSATGKFLASWGQTGTRLGRYEAPLGVAVGRDGRVYVADTANDRVQVIAPDGTPLTAWDRVASNAGLGRLEDPAGIATDPAGRVYVTDTGSDRVQRYSVDGTSLSSWGLSGSGYDGQMDEPFGITVTPRGEVVIADRANDRLQFWGWARPDATIRRGLDGPLIGDDVYNATARHQVLRAGTTGEPVELRAEIQQDGAHRPPLRLRGGAPTRQFDISYWRRGREVTDQVVAGTFQPSYRPNVFRLRILVTPRAGAEPGAVADRLLRVSAIEVAGTDVVRFVVTKR